MQIICDDLKFKDKQNDPQYIMLNSRLKEEKKRRKNTKPLFKIRQTGKREKVIKKPSKFNEKYKERIESIQTSDEKRKENLRNMKR